MNTIKTIRNFINSDKIFTVTLYKKYEGDGGYWNCYDEWVNGPMVNETIEEKSFVSIDKTLEYAENLQEIYLNIEQQRIEKENINIIAKWITKFIMEPNNEVIYEGRIGWGGSCINIKITYKIIEK